MSEFWEAVWYNITHGFGCGVMSVVYVVGAVIGLAAAATVLIVIGGAIGGACRVLGIVGKKAGKGEEKS